MDSAGYFITGAEGREFGPVTFDQITNWISQGRLTSESPARSANAPAWVKMRDFPEFAEALAAAPSPGRILTPHAEEAFATPGWQEEIQRRDYQLDIGKMISEAWEVFKSRPWVWVGGSFLLLAISIGIEAVPVFGQIAGFFLLGPLWAGTTMVALAQMRGQPTDVGTFFQGFGPFFWRLAAVGMIYQLGIALGLVLLVVPGIYLLTVWMYSWALITDKGLPPTDALTLSWRMVQKRFLQNLLLAAVEIGLLLGGAVCLGVGLLVTVPLLAILHSVAYLEIFGRRDLS